MGGPGHETKNHVVLAIDHDRCGKLFNDETVRIGLGRVTGKAARPLIGIVRQLESYGRSHVVVVSFSNRQTDEIQSILGGVNSIEHLQTIAQLLRESASAHLTITVDTRYHGSSKYAEFKSRADITEFESVDHKKSLADSIVAAYPNTPNFLFVDDKYELLPAPTNRIDGLQVSPLIWIRESELNTKMPF
mgnify:CR=1 FL=1